MHLDGNVARHGLEFQVEQQYADMHVLTGLVYGFVGLDEKDIPGLHAQSRGLLEAGTLHLEFVITLGHIGYIERDRAHALDGALGFRDHCAILEQRESNGTSSGLTV